MAPATFSQSTDPKKPIEMNPVVDLMSIQEIQLKGDVSVNNNMIEVTLS